MTTNNNEKTLPKVPRRSLTQYERIPADSVSIIGLGCSSFSTFFWTKDDWKQQQQQNQDPTTQWTVDNLDENHPIVQEWIDTIVYAVSGAGISLLDTAPWYGHGTSETVIGWAIQKLVSSTTQQQPWSRDSILVNTKVGRYEADPKRQFDYSSEKTLASVQTSLQRLQCGTIDVLQLHDPEFAPDMEQLMTETIPAMLKCRDEHHWCRALGMTGYPLEVQHQLLQRSLEVFGKDTRVWDQSLTYGHYNLHDTSLFNRTFVSNGRGGDEEERVSFASYCASRNLCILAAAPLSMGLLTHFDPPAWHPASQELKDACRNAAELCQTAKVDISHLATLFALAEPRIPTTILGLKNIAQVQRAQRAAQHISTETSSDNNDNTADSASALERLKPILTVQEFQVLEQILDPNQGPFASIWANDSYDWDGVAEAQAFWKQVPERKAKLWQHC